LLFLRMTRPFVIYDYRTVRPPDERSRNS
jgi:hypothetical protein